jgi:adenosylcobyric acid synthase
MVLGTTSGAGKSWLATALCRWYARQGLKVAPFKAQNMSNNARVVDALGRQGEIGSAQYYQALAAQVRPDVRMNPLLLKPERDTHSQVVLMGQVNDVLSQTPWRLRSETVWPTIANALDALLEEFDVLVIEGAGSPAEINLMAHDIVNLRVARHAQAQCLLVSDIDRGGSFAHLYGTWALLSERDRAMIYGFVLNKFRGDPSLLAPAPQQLQELTGVETLAVLPMWRDHGLPQEDGLFEGVTDKRPSTTSERSLYVVSYPQMSNLDEFEVLQKIPGLRLIWARTPRDLSGLQLRDWVILPGSKLTSADLGWLRAQALDQVILSHALKGGQVLGICGGLQMLGSVLEDPYGVDGQARGLGLLGLSTRFEVDKTVKTTHTQFAQVHGAWQALSHLSFKGFEIHHGQTRVLSGEPHAQLVPSAMTHELIQDLAWQNEAGNVLGLYVHGLFENSNVLKALFGDAGESLEQVFEGLADFLELHLPRHHLLGLIESC